MMGGAMYNVVIIGLGLIGGSLAKAFRTHPSIQQIVGVDAKLETCEKALQEGTIHSYYSEPCEDALSSADIVFFCTPVDFILPTIKRIVPYIPSQCILTDVGSTKKQIVDQVHALFPHLHFIGGHPMAGSEKAGYEASSPTLFQNCYYILTPSSCALASHIHTLEYLISSLGAVPIVYDAKTHDFCTAGISHVPHILAAGFVNMICSLDQEGHMAKIASTGFKDFTRISASNPEIWSQITLQNKENILIFLEKYHHLLYMFEDELRKENYESIYRFFESSKNYRDSF